MWGWEWDELSLGTVLKELCVNRIFSVIDRNSPVSLALPTNTFMILTNSAVS